MPADLATTNGQAAMAYTGSTPWHQLGTALDDPFTADIAIESGGLDYDVHLKPIYANNRAIPKRHATVRSDNGEILGVVGDTYSPVQNRECFSFLDSLVADGELQYHTVGALGEGERVWMLAKLPGEIRLFDSEDATEKYLLLSNSHDGTSALRVFFTPIRVVCANTLGMAERQAHGSGVAIVHRGDIDQKVQEAREVLGLAHQFFEHSANQFEKLARYKPSPSELDDYFRQLYPDRPETKSKRAANVRAELTRLFEAGLGQEIPETRRSMWSAFNAVTEYVDHHRSGRGRTIEERTENRLKSSWFGGGAQLKRAAWRAALRQTV